MADRKDEERKTPSWQLPKESQPATDAYHIWTPRPLLRSVYWKPDPLPPDDATLPAYEVFIDQRAWTTMHEHVWQAEAEKTPFGYLIGDLCEDPNAGRRFVSITAALPARFDFDEESPEQISREATLALQLEVERRRGVLAGWYHRHLGGDAALTDADVATHHQHFREPWQCAFLFVGGGDRSDGGCFRSSVDAPGGGQPVPFYEMASNESLLARGVKRSYVDWGNYTTVDEIRSEPRARPTLEIPEPAAAPESEPDPDPTPPDAPSAGEPAAEMKQETAPAPDPEPDEDPVEDASPGAEAGDEDDAGEEGDDGNEEAPIQEAPRTEDGELDFDAIIDEVKAARIEFDESELADTDEAGDPESEAPADPEAPDWMSAEQVEPDVATDQAPRPGPPSPDAAPDPPPAPRPAPTPPASESPASAPKAAPSPQAVKSGDPGRGQLIGLVALGLVLLAAIGWGLVTVLGGDGAPTEPGAVDSVPASPLEGNPDGAARAGSASAVGDSVAGQVAVTAAAVDSAGRDMLATISRFYGRAVDRDNGTATCEDLEAAFVAVENEWIRYNNEYKGRFEGDLPAELAQRDDRLYAGIQDAEVEYERSGCPRP